MALSRRSVNPIETLVQRTDFFWTLQTFPKSEAISRDLKMIIEIRFYHKNHKKFRFVCFTQKINKKKLDSLHFRRFLSHAAMSVDIPSYGIENFNFLHQNILLPFTFSFDKT